MIYRRAPGRPSAVCRTLQSRSLAGFSSGYATLPRTAPPLNDASTAHGGEAASTLTLLPKQRGREQTGCCQLLRLGSFLRGLEANLDSRSPVAGPCRNHASPQSHIPTPCGARGLYSAPAAGQPGVRSTGLAGRRRLPARPRKGARALKARALDVARSAAGAAVCGQPLYLDGPTCGYIPCVGLLLSTLKAPPSGEPSPITYSFRSTSPAG